MKNFGHREHRVHRDDRCSFHVRCILCDLCVLCGLWFAFSFSSAYADDELHLYNWNNYISEETIARFEEQCVCRVVQDYYSDNEEMLAKLAAGATGYDLIVPTAMRWNR